MQMKSDVIGNSFVWVSKHEVGTGICKQSTESFILNIQTESSVFRYLRVENQFKSSTCSSKQRKQINNPTNNRQKN